MRPSSTSISAGLGMAIGRDLADAAARARGETPPRRNVVAVIGDGSISAGMAYEAMNNAGALKSRLIVILNDNDMSIAPPVGAMSSYLARLVSGDTYRSLRDTAKQFGRLLPKALYDTAARAEEYARGMLAGGGTMFEELGFHYVGPIDGHNLEHLLPVLKNVRDAPDGPVLVHVVTQKGKGYAPAEAAADRGHAVVKFDVVSGKQTKAKPNAPAYTRVFGESLIKAADADDKVVAITAAMPSGTGLDVFSKAHPDRTFDVGIAEQHAVTFAAGLATEGFKPFCAIYSTFLQRGYDQLVHDVALQNLPVRFALDRAGLVGADGATHAGAFDLAYLCCLPNMTVMAAADEAELVHMVATAHAHDTGPIAFRYPRGEGVGVEMPERGEVLEIGKGRVIQRPEGARVALLSLGTRLAEALKAAERLEAAGIGVTVADARFAKPLDEALILDLAGSHEVLVTLEEGSVGGFGAMVLHLLSSRGALDDGTVRVRTLTLPDSYQDHDTPDRMYARPGSTRRRSSRSSRPRCRRARKPRRRATSSASPGASAEARPGPHPRTRPCSGYLITAQAMRAPALPIGCVRWSSSLAWMISAEPSLSFRPPSPVSGVSLDTSAFTEPSVAAKTFGMSPSSGPSGCSRPCLALS